MRTATYKGKRYRLDYLGSTRFGYRAKLSFFNGRKSFWVDGSRVYEIYGNSYPKARLSVNPDITHEPPPPYEDEFDEHMAEMTEAERRNATIIDSGYDAYAREEGHYDIPF